MTQWLPGIRTISAGAVDIVSIDMTNWLDAAELMTGTPVTTDLAPGASDLTMTDQQVNTVAVTILGKEVAIGKAIQFKVVGQVADTLYKIRFQCSTTAAVPRTCSFVILLQCE